MNPNVTRLLWYTGIPFLSRRLLAHNGRFVLMLHGISCRRYPNIALGVQPYVCKEDLRSILAWVRRRFTFLTPDEFLLTNKPGVLLTFDDGFANNAANALPILEEFEAPAIFFVSTQHVTDPKKWLPASRQFARNGWGTEERVPFKIAKDFYDGLSETQLCACAGHSLITIGSHTVSHPFLTRCSDRDLQEELEGSKRYLESLIGEPVKWFAYPTGDYDRRVIEAVRRAAYRAAFVADSRRIGIPQYEIPRVGLYEANPAYLSLKLSGLRRRLLASVPVAQADLNPSGKSRQLNPSWLATSQKIKVVYLIGQLGYGGSERQLYLLLKHFDKEGFDLHVVVFNNSPYLVFDQTLKELGVQVHTLPENCRGITRRARFLYRLFRRLSPDIVHSWSIHDNPYAGLIGYLAGVPLRLGSVRALLSTRGFRDLPKLFRLLSLHTTDYLVVNTRAIAEELYQRGLSASYINVIPNCVETDCRVDQIRHRDSPADLGLSNGRRIVGMVANLRRLKNHLMFVEGLAKLLTGYPDVSGVIVGQPIPDETDYPALIQAKIVAHGMEGRIVLAGFRSDVPVLMDRFSVFCLTSDYEGTPNVILEAMAAARPVVATRVGGIPDLVQECITGFLVEPGDVNGFAAKVKTLLDEPALAERMGRAGRERVERKYSCEQAAQQFARLYLDRVPRG